MLLRVVARERVEMLLMVFILLSWLLFLTKLLLVGSPAFSVPTEASGKGLIHAKITLLRSIPWFYYIPRIFITFQEFIAMDGVLPCLPVCLPRVRQESNLQMEGGSNAEPHIQTWKRKARQGISDIHVNI